MIVKVAVSVFLIAHGAVHAGFLSPRPAPTPGAPAWPFELGRSWVLSPAGVGPDAARLLGTALVAVTIAGFALAALTVVGIAPAGLWRPAVAVGAAASVALIGLFFHPWLVLGLGIDAVVLWLALATEWGPRTIGT